MRLLHAIILGEMVLQTIRAPWFLWLKWTGRGAEVDPIVHRLVSAWAARILRLHRCEIRVEGLENVPASGPIVVASNHQSLFDIPVYLAHLGRLMGFVAKKELFRIPGLTYWMRKIHCAPIDRANVAGGGKLLEELSQDIRRNGFCMIIFPEGTRTKHPDAEIAPFRRGALRIAQSAGIPVLPISIDGTRFLVSPAAMHATEAGGRVVRVRVGQARMPPPADSPAPENKRFMDELREEIVSNWRSIRVHWPQA
jgi:1-acyl-sn-glycerol-3-phosphate acyltransferase